MKKSLLRVLMAICLMLSFAVFAVPAQAAATLGGQLYATGGDITVEILPPGGAYTSDLYLFSPDYMYIGSTTEAGKVVTITGMPAGQELVFGIYVRNTGHTFMMGAGSLNPDGLEHAVVEQFGEGLFLVGFEDLFGGGDRDYDDNKFLFRGALITEPPAVDNVPPASVHTTAQAANMNGWINEPVMVNLSATDTAQADVSPSGVEQIFAAVNGSDMMCPAGASCEFMVGTSGVHTVSYYARDMAGNTESLSQFQLNVDLEAPEVLYAGNAGTYAIDEMVTISCLASDALSGVASTDCAEISGEAWSFGLGSHPYSASATDMAGNIGSGSVTFTVGVSEESLCRLVEQWSSNPGVAHSLCVKLHNAAAAETPEAQSGLIEAFMHEVEAQSGKAFTGEQAVLVVQLAEML